MDRSVERELEEASERRFYATMLRVVWTALIGLAGAGVLTGMTLLLGWGSYLLLCLLGLLAGVAIAVALLESGRARALTGLILGAVTLPVLAASLGVLAVYHPAGLEAYSARLVPFLAYASGTLLCGVGIARLWRPAAVAPARETGAKNTLPDTGGATP